jgi:hypothetical protein
MIEKLLEKDLYTSKQMKMKGIWKNLQKKLNFIKQYLLRLGQNSDEDLGYR